MPGLPLQTDAFVLLKRPPSDAFQGFNVFSPTHGALLVHQRISKKAAASSIALDLFDEVSLRLESSNQGQTWFVQEVRLITRHADLGRSYDTLRHASALAALVARNPVHEDSRDPVAALLRQALAAFAAGARPELVWFKSLYCFARDEGYPVKQDWLASLPAALRTAAAQRLHTPLTELAKTEMENPKSELLIERLEHYLRTHTEVLLE